MHILRVPCCLPYDSGFSDSIEGFFSLPWPRQGLCAIMYNGEPLRSRRATRAIHDLSDMHPGTSSIPPPYLGRQLAARPHFCTDMLRICSMGLLRTCAFMENLPSMPSITKAKVRVPMHTRTVDAVCNRKHGGAKIPTASKESLARRSRNLGQNQVGELKLNDSRMRVKGRAVCARYHKEGPF